MGYNMDMSEEKKATTKVLLPEGRRVFQIVGCEEKTSKAGNLMFVFTARDEETSYDDTWYAVAVPKKRWFLKSVLSACGCKASEDGVYDWEISDIVGRNISGLVVHEDTTWINREGETVVSKQHKIVDIEECVQLRNTNDVPEKSTMTKEEKQKKIDNNEIAWDE